MIDNEVSLFGTLLLDEHTNGVNKNNAILLTSEITLLGAHWRPLVITSRTNEHNSSAHCLFKKHSYSASSQRQQRIIHINRVRDDANK